MVWGQGGAAQDLAFLGIDDINRKKVNPQKVVPGSLFALAKTNVLEPPSQEDKSAQRMSFGLQRMGVVDSMSDDIGGYGNDYLEKAENLMFKANQVSAQAQQKRLEALTPRFQSQKNVPVRLTQLGGGGGGPGKGNASFQRFKRAISGKESGGNYHVVNKSSGALGRYQVMPANIAGPGGWDKQMIGRNVTTRQYLNSPKLQEQIAGGMLLQYFRKYGAAGAASAWYSGSPTKWKQGAGQSSQGAYPTIYNYVQSILRAMGR